MNYINKTIYTFWLGDEKRKQELIKYHKEINQIIYPWKIELGPTEQEHEYFLKKFRFYKKAFNERIYSFCSDVYRFYKILHNGGLYIDSGVVYNKEKICSFLKELENFNYLFVYEEPLMLWSGMFYIKDKNDTIIKKCLQYYHKIALIDLYIPPIAPFVISCYVFKKLSFFPEKIKGIKCLKSFELKPENNDNIFYLGCKGTWIKNKQVNHEIFIKNIWNEKFEKFNIQYSEFELKSLRKNQYIHIYQIYYQIYYKALKLWIWKKLKKYNLY